MEIESLNHVLRNKLEEDIGMTPDTVKQDVSNLKNWINCQPHLPTLDDDEETIMWLRNFLVQCKNSMIKAKEKLENYFSCKSLVPELFVDRNPSDSGIVSSVKTLYLFPLPKLTPDGCRIHIFCHADPDPAAYNPNDFMRRALMFLDWKIKEDVTCGDIFIFHMKYSSLAHLSKYNFITFSRFIAVVINAYPLRVKAIHFTLAPSFISQVISNPFITKKIKKKIKIHSGNNIEELLTDIPANCLPRELGGTLDHSLWELNDFFHQKLINMKKWFEESQSIKTDESKRLPEIKTNGLFGCNGNFRSLEVD